MSRYEADNQFQIAQARSIDVQNYINRLKNKPGQDPDFVKAIEALGMSINALAHGLREMLKA